MDSEPDRRSLIGVEFDSGINTSAAWTEHVAAGSERRGHTQEASLSDDEPETNVPTRSAALDEIPPIATDTKESGEQEAHPARTLYDFDGKPEFGELTIPAGVDLVVLKSDLGDGWSLVDYNGRVGLLPTSYYTLTASFVQLPAEPCVSDPREATASPLEPQLTGTDFPSFRKTLLGGRALNRFASFVTSGAEDWILHGQPLPTSIEGSDSSTADEDSKYAAASIIKHELAFKKPDWHFIDSGPSWRSKVPSFRVMVHSPYKHTSALSSSYTVYLVTSMFDANPQASMDEEETPPRRVTVHRRFSHFVSLHTALSRKLPGIALPPLPGKQYSGRFNDAFVEARRGDLEQYLARLIRHPVVRYAEALNYFLSCENDTEWRKYVIKSMDSPSIGAEFYARIYHPSFNLDIDECKTEGENFMRHIIGIESSMQWLRNVFAKIRVSRAEEASNLRLFSYALLGLITSRPVGSVNSISEAPDEEVNPLLAQSSPLNNQGAWCWRDNCDDCLGLSKALQKTAESLHHIAGIHDNSAHQRQFAIHEHLKDCSHPVPVYESVVDIQQGAIAHCQRSSGSSYGTANDELIARCETILNVAAAEMDVFHDQKVQDMKKLAEDYLDEEIDLHEKVKCRN